MQAYRHSNKIISLLLFRLLLLSFFFWPVPAVTPAPPPRAQDTLPVKKEPTVKPKPRASQLEVANRLDHQHCSGSFHRVVDY